MKKITYVIVLFMVFCLVTPCLAKVRDIQDNHKVVYHVVDGDGNHVGSETVTLAIQVASDGDWYDFNDDTFKAAGWTSKTVNLTEDATNGFYHYTFNPPASETGADEYVFLVDNASATYGDHQSDTVTYQDIGTGTSTHAAADIWSVATRALTILDEDSTTIDLDASYVGGVTTFDEDTTTIDIDGTTIGTVTTATNLTTNNDKTGYSIADSTSDAVIADAIWNAAVASYGTANTYGALVETNLDTTVSSRGTSTLTTADNIGINWADVAAPTTTVGLTNTTISTTQVVASVSGAVGSVTGGVTVSTNNDKTGYSIADSTSDAVIADAVWNAATASYGTADTYGVLIETDLDATVSSRSSHTAANVWSVGTRILTALDEDATTIDLDGSYVGGVTTFDEDSTTIDIDGTTLGTVTTATNLTTNNDKTGYSLSGAGIDSIWDELQSGHATGGSFGLYLDQSVSTAGSGSAVTAAIADAVLDELLSGHTVSGSLSDTLSDITDATDGDKESGVYTGVERMIRLNR